jgi:hypothetical protein
MIPQVRAGSSPDSSRALMIAVILSALLRGSVSPARGPRRPLPSFVTATIAAVHVPAIAPSVHPELATAMATLP